MPWAMARIHALHHRAKTGQGQADSVTAAEARKAAGEATEHVAYLRRLLGQAMAAEAEALKVAREAEAVEARG